MRSILIIPVLSCLLALCCSVAQAAGIPAVSDAEIEQALSLSGSNRSVLEQALAAVDGELSGRSAMRFVVASLPLCDLGSITAGQLADNQRLALEARLRFPWGDDYDDATFAHFVLPPRVSQEPLTDWRGFFFGELQDQLGTATTLEEAAVLVNKWCGQRVGFRQTQRRDQDPLATLASGYGRCEEMVIFYVDACRAVGIPARMAYCPYWAVSDNNHAWVEVFGSDGRWHWTGGCEPAEKLDDAWFNGAVKNAPLVCSMAFGLPGERDDTVLSTEEAVGSRFTRFNSTSFYRDTGLLAIEIPTVAGANDHSVTVHVFNYGALRSIARVPLDENGKARITLGLGTFVISTDAPVEQNQTMVEMRAGEVTELYWDALTPLPDELLLQFPADSTAH